MLKGEAFMLDFPSDCEAASLGAGGLLLALSPSWCRDCMGIFCMSELHGCRGELLVGCCCMRGDGVSVGVIWSSAAALALMGASGVFGPCARGVPSMMSSNRMAWGACKVS